jgi:predicted O-linked N-acetylglucosamine transferase (SPINDLY family)
VVCYSGVIAEDELTREFRQSADIWRPMQDLSDDALAEQIRADGIDILIDLSGHSAGSRLTMFAHKPAPVQVTAWGHATGTGLPTIDYLYSDPVAVPEPCGRFSPRRSMTCRA